MKENSNLKSELMGLCEYMDKAKVEAIAEFQTSQTYFDEMGAMYGDDFKDFRKQAILLYPGVEFSQVQIDTVVLPTPGPTDVLDEEET